MFLCSWAFQKIAMLAALLVVLFMADEAKAAGFRRGGQQIQAGPAGVQINQGGRGGFFRRGGQQIQVTGGGFGGAAFGFNRGFAVNRGFVGVNPFFAAGINPFFSPFAVNGCGFGAAQFQSFGVAPVPAFGGGSLQINQQRGIFGGIRSQQIQSSGFGGSFQLNQ